MKIVKWLLIIVVIGVALFFGLRWLVGRVSPMPENLGAVNGRFGKLSAGRCARQTPYHHCVYVQQHPHHQRTGLYPRRISLSHLALCR